MWSVSLGTVVSSCLALVKNLWILFIKLLIVRVLQGSWLEWYARGPTESKTIGVKGEDL